MSNIENITFIDNTALKNANGQYVSIMVDVPLTLESWRNSIFSFQWLNPEGAIKSLEDLAEEEQPKRQRAEDQLEQGLPIEKPILGIGIQDNIEIGAGRAELLTLAAYGLKTMPVHIPKSNEKDFKAFLADVDS